MRLLPISGLVVALAFTQGINAQSTPAQSTPAQSTPAQSSADTPPSLIYRSEPEYSAEATRARVQSSVTLSVVIGEDGRARDIHVSQGAGFGLDEKAIEAMDKWRFNPATHDGKPIAVPANIDMNFSILAKNDKEDHSGQRARLNFTLPPDTSRPELVAGILPANPAASGDQSLRFHLEVDAQGVPKNVTLLDSNDPAWGKQVMRVVQTWRFRPASLNGNPVAVEGVFEMQHSGEAETEPAVVDPEVEATSDEPSAPAVQHVAAPLAVGGLTPRSRHTATRLPNGTILLAGGQDLHPLASAQIYDWATRGIANTGAMTVARSDHTATLLRDGMVLIAGGHAAQPLASAEIFDPSTGRFSKTGSLRGARESHAAALLPDGRVLICGGTGVGNKTLASAEIYDPHTKTFTAAANMAMPRSSFHAVTLKDGRILLLGGSGAAGATAEIYDPAHGTFRAAGSMKAPRYGFSATLLANGKVLIAGGSTAPDGRTALTTAELYDPSTSAFQPTGPLSSPREFHDGLLLNNGKVLVSGGIPGSHEDPISPTEIYDPASATFGPGPVLNGRHTGHTSTLLQDGRVLIAGSGFAGNGASAELLDIN